MNNTIMNPNFKFLTRIKEKLLKVITFARTKVKQNMIFFDRILLTILYLYAFLTQLATLRLILGSLPELYQYLFPSLESIVAQPFLRTITDPDQTFIIYYIIIEFLIHRPIIRFSLIVRFNIIFLCILELMQNVAYNLIDLLFAREFEQVLMVSQLSSSLINIINVLFNFLYIYCYYQAIRGKLPRFPGSLQKFVDSIAFWLRVKRISKKKTD